MNMLNDKRTACVGTTMETELLRINKGIILFQHLFGVLNNHWNSFDLDDFFKIANVQDEKNSSYKMAQLSKIPFLAAAADGFIERACNFFKPVAYEPNETILMEGSDNAEIAWILKGSCRCVKIIPFVQKSIKSGHSSIKMNLRVPDANIPLGEDEEIVNEILNVCTLDIGSHFPDIPQDPSIQIDRMIEETFSKEKYLDFLGNIDPSSNYERSFVSVIANEKVEVLVIPRIEFCKLVNSGSLFRMLSDQSMLRVPILQIQEAYIQQLSWQSYKKKVIGQIVKKN